jgi:autotransporter-associated beta strand protein
MKRILLFSALLVSFCSYSQSVFEWQNTAPDGNWRQGAGGGARWTGGLWDEPGFGILRFNNNHQTSMTNNVSSTYSQHQIQFGANATSSRTIGASAGSIVKLFDYGGNDPKIENYSTATHTFGTTFNLEGDGDGVDPLQINPINGNLVFNGSINNSGSWIDVYGDNGKSLIIGGVISGSGGITVYQNSTVYLQNESNSYTGATRVQAGSIVIARTGFTATITTSGINVAFSSVPTRGTYVILPGALSSNATLSTSGLGVGKTASFNASTGVLTVNDTPTVSLISSNSDNSFCAETSVTFTASANQIGGGTVNYNFIVAGSSVQSSSSATYSTTGLTNGQAVTVEITVSGGTFLSSNSATSNTIINTVVTPQLWYLDADNDGYYTGSPISSCDSPGLGYKTFVFGGGDCNDNNSAIHPNGEICFNNIDDDCDGVLSNGCATPPVVITSPSCGSTLSYRNAAITSNAVSIPGHTVQYRFRIENENFDVSILRDVPSFTLQQASYAAYVHPAAATYNVYVALVVDGELQPESAACAISVVAAAAPGQSLQNCETVLTTPSTLVFTPSVSGALEYQFEISQGGNVLALFNKSTNSFHSTVDFPGWNYGTTYTVRAQARKSGESFNLDLVTPCNLTYPAVPVPAQAISACSTTLTNVSSLVFTTTIFGATSYQFELTEGGNTHLLTRTSANFHFTTDFAQWNYGKTYSVRTRVARNGGNYGEWSAACNLTSPAIPTPAQGLNNCATVMTSAGSYLYAPTIFGATDYQFEVTSAGGFYDSFTKSVPYFRLSDVEGWISGTTYGVRVYAIRNSVVSEVSPTTCTFTTPGAAPSSLVARMAQVPFAVKAYPNPYSDGFQLNVVSSYDKTATVSVKVYDMLGRLVDSKNTTTSDLETTTIGSEYPSGVYNVIVTQENETKTVRVVKR